MVVTQSEIICKGDVESAFQSDQQLKNQAFPSLGRQSSIYSLTLDEFQHTLCESGKKFGSMNMDEFLNSIWTAEENQVQAQAQAQAQVGNQPNPTTTTVTASDSNGNLQFLTGNSLTNKGIARQLSLQRQGSLMLPTPLCRKTVDEVWLEIRKSKQEPQQSGGNNNNNVQNSGSTQRQPTFGEMTLEDFLIRAGIVREHSNPQTSAPQQEYGLYQNNSNPGVGPGFVTGPITGFGGGSGGGDSINMPTYLTLPQGGVGGVGESTGYAGNGKSGGYLPPPSTMCYGVRVASASGGGGGYGQVEGLGMGSPVSPVSSGGMCVSQVDGTNQYGMDMGGMRGGRKQIIDGSVEVVVERRQRRMIKNRASAARSRARKQAYTVELDAELNQLKEENAQLKQDLAELERKRRQQCFEEVKMKTWTKAQKATEKLRMMRKRLSCPL